MRVRVVVPPEPIVLPADIFGSHAADDAGVAAMIAAVTEEIDGPGGWLGRSLGPQTLELVKDCWGGRSIRLPCGPVIAIDSLVYLDVDGIEQTVDGSSWSRTGDLLWLRPTFSAPTLSSEPWPIRIRYQAGYDGRDIDSGGTGPVPERARQAIILSVQDMLRLGTAAPALRSETVEGIGSQTYLDADRVSAIVQKRCDALLWNLRANW
jgi:hypothetical protein